MLAVCGGRLSAESEAACLTPKGVEDWWDICVSSKNKKPWFPRGFPHKCARQELNLQPLASEANALSN